VTRRYHSRALHVERTTQSTAGITQRVIGSD
jgi:hypothetical protein